MRSVSSRNLGLAPTISPRLCSVRISSSRYALSCSSRACKAVSCSTWLSSSSFKRSTSASACLSAVMSRAVVHTDCSMPFSITPVRVIRR